MAEGRQPNGRFAPGNNANPSGRPLNLDDSVIESICKYIEEGMPIEGACYLADVPKSTLYYWLKIAVEQEQDFIYKNKNKMDARDAIATREESVYLRFLDAIKKADAKHFHMLLRRLELHGKKNWLADATVAERRHPQWFARQDRLQVQHELTPATVSYLKDLDNAEAIVEGEFKQLT